MNIFAQNLTGTLSIIINLRIDCLKGIKKQAVRELQKNLI